MCNLCEKDSYLAYCLLDQQAVFISWQAVDRKQIWHRHFLQWCLRVTVTLCLLLTANCIFLIEWYFLTDELHTCKSFEMIVLSIYLFLLNTSLNPCVESISWAPTSRSFEWAVWWLPDHALSFNTLHNAWMHSVLVFRLSALCSSMVSFEGKSTRHVKSNSGNKLLAEVWVSKVFFNKPSQPGWLYQGKFQAVLYSESTVDN